MKLSKGQGISLFAGIVLFAVFTIIAFLAQVPHTIVFWMGYFFVLFALVTMVLHLVLFFGKPIKEEKFLSLPSIKVSWIYFVLQIGLSIWEITSFPLSYFSALIINLVVSAFFVILILALHASTDRIDRTEQVVAEKVLFIKQLKLKLDSIETENAEVEKLIKELAEDVRYSDPMSHSKLESIENELSCAVDEIAENVADAEKALILCNNASKLLKKRNEQCKMLKGVKDEKTEKIVNEAGSGKGIALSGVIVALSLFLITLCVYFIFVPQSKYNDAKKLFESGKYVDAISAFKELGDYRDSNLQIEQIQNTILEEKYKVADGFLKNGEYNKAVEAFTEIKDYADSENKINEARNASLQGKYDEAEKLFNSGKYSKAIDLYSSLGDFEDSKIRVEQIYNRLSDGEIIYLGTYENSPIAWKILKTESNKLLLITKKTIENKPFNEEIEKVSWKTCSLRSWLNEEFITSFSEEQQKRLVLTNNDNTSDKIFLLDVNEVEELSGKIKLRKANEWWTRTTDDSGCVCVSAEGSVQAKGEPVVRDKGVRPVIWFSLK